MSRKTTKQLRKLHTEEIELRQKTKDKSVKVGNYTYATSLKFADDFAMWTSLLVYAAVWVGLPISWMGVEYWPLAVLWTLIYLFAHLATIANGHCYLEADSLGVPLLLLTNLIFIIANLHFDWISGREQWVAFCISFVVALIAGHLFALLYSAIMTSLLRRL